MRSATSGERIWASSSIKAWRNSRRSLVMLACDCLMTREIKPGHMRNLLAASCAPAYLSSSSCSTVVTFYIMPRGRQERARLSYCHFGDRPAHVIIGRRCCSSGRSPIRRAAPDKFHRAATLTPSKPGDVYINRKISDAEAIPPARQ